MNEPLDIASKLFNDIQQSFPALIFTKEENPHVDLSVTIPKQEGVLYETWLGLQNNDELSFGVRSFQLEWFPCTDKTNQDSFVEAVKGFLSGNYRILEHWKGNKCYKAELQKPIDHGWKTIGRWGILIWFLVPLKTKLVEIRNM